MKIGNDKIGNAKIIYSNIIDLPHHISQDRNHMSLHDRAAQFAPFAALSGYDAMVKEEARLTGRRAGISDREMDVLNQKMELILDAIADGRHPIISLTVFIKDSRKDGGSYETFRGPVKTIDRVSRKVILFGTEDTDDRTIDTVEIEVDEIADISGELVDYLDEC